MAEKTAKKNGSGSLGFEEKLWLSADKMRGNMDAAEYKHVVLGLIFLKYISDAFEEKHDGAARGGPGADPEDRDEYLADNVFWVPQEARWPHLAGRSQAADHRQGARRRDGGDREGQPALKGVLPKDYARPTLDKRRLGRADRPDRHHRAGREPQQPLEGHRWAASTSTSSASSPRPKARAAASSTRPGRVVRLLVEMIEPLQGPRLRPLLRLRRHVRAVREVRRERTAGSSATSRSTARNQPTTWRLAQDEPGHPRHRRPTRGTTRRHASTTTSTRTSRPTSSWPTRRSTISDWGGERLRDDVRWKYGVPPAGNANYAWMQHFIHHLAPNGMAGFVLANGSMSSNSAARVRSGRRIVEADLVDCMVALPGQLFYTTQIPVCLWFLARNKNAGRLPRPARRDAVHRRPQDGHDARPHPP